jgi:hypothetical protein
MARPTHYLTLGSLPDTPLHFFLCPFLDQQNRLLSCPFPQLLRSVVVLEPSGFILSNGRANGNTGPLFRFSPASYLIRNFG